MNRLLTDLSLLKRVGVAVVWAPLIVWLFWTRGIPLFVFLTAVTLLGQWELFTTFSKRGRRPNTTVGYLAGLAILFDAWFRDGSDGMVIFVAAAMLLFVVEIFSRKSDKLENITLSLFATAYPALFVVFFFKVDAIETLALGQRTNMLLLFTVLIVWAFDTASYFVGMRFGKHRFFDDISPKKTVEGFIGGMLAAPLTAVVIGCFVNPGLIPRLVALSVVIGLSGQMGDLSESIIKRDMGIKDSSNIIPGHGGILDRFDSLFFAAPAVYVYIRLLLAISGGFE